MQTLSISRSPHAKHNSLPDSYIITTSLNPLYHSAVSFATETTQNTNTLLPESLGTENPLTNLNRPTEPDGKPPDTGTINNMVHMDDDEDDSEYIGDSNEEIESSDGDVSLEDQNTMETADEVVEPIV